MRVADAAVVGSALIDTLASSLDAEGRAAPDTAERVLDQIRELAAGVRGARGMSWLNEYVRPRIRTLFGAREVPDNLWVQCPNCQQMLFTKDLDRALKVCPHCGYHMRVTASERLDYTFDPADSGPGYTRIELPRVPQDPLHFRDSKRYVDRLKEARDSTGLNDAILVAHGTINGHRAVVAAMAFEFMAGSMGAAVGEAIVAAARLAVLQQAPLIVFTASGGARMQEGAISLMQMPRTTIATRLVKDASSRSSPC